MANNSKDIIIIGAGIVGCMVARALSRYQLDVMVIEKEHDVGMGASSANSAILHAGYDPKPNTLKAAMNVRGNKLWDGIVGELDIPVKKTGSYVVAIGEEEMPHLEELYERGIANGIAGMRILSRAEFLQKEPLINPKVTGALWTPSAGVIDPFRAVVATAENAVHNGVRFIFNCAFTEFLWDNDKIFGVRTEHGDFTARWVINCAGVYADQVMHQAHIRPEFQITPRRGEYLIFDETKLSLNNVLFPVPSQKGKGTLVSTTTHGNVMIGPNAVNVEDKTDTETSRDGSEEILANARKLVPTIQARDVIAQFAGIRATGNTSEKDFIIENPIKGFINIAGIDSPGFVSAPAIAERALELMREASEAFIERRDYQPIRKAPPCFHLLSNKEKAELVQKNPAYGRIVCRCEEITEGEILDAIHSPIPAHTYDSIKRRTWLGTGRCQGGFDYPRVLEILSKELGISVNEVSKRGKGSELVYRTTKDVGGLL